MAATMESLRRDSRYRALLRHALLRLVGLYFIPLLLLTLFFHFQYRIVIRDIEGRHRQSLAEHQAGLLNMFLGDRLLNLMDLTDDAVSLVDPAPDDLAVRLAGLQSVSDAFVDLAVLDPGGRVLGYAGPFPELVDANYAQEAWFRRLMAGRSSHVITDVYPGFRDRPHFTMAFKVEVTGRVRVVRAVLSPEIARARLPDPDLAAGGGPSGGLPPNTATSLWLVTLAFCLLGGLVIWVQARWVARQQFASERKEEVLSRQLMQSAKLATVGELAAGIAHEINNPLAVIAERTGLVRDLMDPGFERDLTPGELEDYLEVVHKSVFRCTGITRQLLGFVRQADVNLTEFDVHRVLDDLVDGLLLAELEVDDIGVVRDYDPDLGPVVSDSGQLRQVILNLMKNAHDAIGSAGTITLTTRRQGGRFTLEVADTGCGMTPQQLEKVFLPFFTTKASGRGTGLGLSVSYGIVSGLGGHLGVASVAGEGTVFTIDLPLKG